MSDLLPFAMRAIAHLDPAHEHPELATAIASVVEDHRPLLPSDSDKTKTLSLMIAISYRESTFNNEAIGDTGTSHCAFQVHLPGASRTIEGWTGEDLRADVNRCVSVAFRMLQSSVRVSSSAPVASYARGPRWQSEEAQRISRDRVALAARVRKSALAEVSP